MRFNGHVLGLMTIIAALCGAPSLTKAADTTPTVSAEGSASIQKQPTMLRISLELSATEKDAATAMAKLVEMRETAKKKLKALNSIDGSIVVSDSSVGMGSSLSDRQEQIQRMMMMNRGGKKGPVAKTVTVSSTIKAALALPTGSADELLVKSQELEDKVRASLAVAGPATKPAATPEEQEMAEEMASSSADNMPGMAKPGEPQFTYVFPISEDDAKKVTADAIAKAKADAGLLASSAGMKLGPVYQLSSGEQSSHGNPYSEYMGQVADALTAKPEDGVREAAGSQSGKVKYTATVTATFVLQP